jgi:hypothetical protein
MGTTLRARRLEKHPAFRAKVAHLRLPLAPLVKLSTGQAHPSFPGTLLQYWLLTERQLDDLAHFYDQSTPNAYTQAYPCPIPWLPRRRKGESREVDPGDENSMRLASRRLEMKRRRWGRFMGLRGCDTPVLDVDSEVRKRVLWEGWRRRRNGGGGGDGGRNDLARRSF